VKGKIIRSRINTKGSNQRSQTRAEGQRKASICRKKNDCQQIQKGETNQRGKARRRREITITWLVFSDEEGGKMVRTSPSATRMIHFKGKTERNKLGAKSLKWE